MQKLYNIKLFFGLGLGLAAVDSVVESDSKSYEDVIYKASTAEEVGLRWDSGLAKLHVDMGLDFNQIYNYGQRIPQVLYLGIKIGVGVGF